MKTLVQAETKASRKVVSFSILVALVLAVVSFSILAATYLTQAAGAITQPPSASSSSVGRPDLNAIVAMVAFVVAVVLAFVVSATAHRVHAKQED